MKNLDKRYIAIVFLCGLCMLTSLLLGGTVILTYTSVICKDLGIARASFSVYMTIKSIVAFLLNLAMVFLLKKFSMKQLMVVGMWATAVMVFLFSAAKSLSMIYIGAFIGGIAGACVGMVPLSMIITNWFRDGKGVAFGIVTSFSGIGGFILMPFFGKLVDKIGWRAAFRLDAAVCVAFMVVIMAALRERPKDCGMEPYADPKRLENGVEIFTESEKRRLSDASVLTPSRFKIIANVVSVQIIAGGYTLGALILCTNIAPVVEWAGFPVVFATGTAVSVYSLTNCVGKFVMGRMNDKGHMIPMLLIFYGLCIPSALFFYMYHGSAVPVGIAGCLLIGMTGGIYSIPIPLICGRLCPNRNSYNLAISMSTAVVNLCNAAGGVIFHGLYDWTGSYNCTLRYVLILDSIVFVTVVLLIIHNRPQFRD